MLGLAIERIRKQFNDVTILHMRNVLDLRGPWWRMPDQVITSTVRPIFCHQSNGDIGLLPRKFTNRDIAYQCGVIVPHRDGFSRVLLEA